MLRHRTVLKYALAVVLALATPRLALAFGSLVDVEVVDRTDGRVLPIYHGRGERWVVGTPGHEYLLRLRNRTGARVLAVTSVDGVNVVTGDTASPAQSGYVLDSYGTVEIAGWRKSLATTAAFYFTDLGDSYASRTGRPDNVGVIGVAVFRERRMRLQDERQRLDAPRNESAAEAAPDATPSAKQRGEAARAAAPAPSLGTGHGRSEASAAERVYFVRDSTTPAEIIAVRYDRRENLAALGVLPPPPIAGMPRPFPDWTPGFVPDPPRR